MNIIAYDLGTGGIKASLYDSKMYTLSKVFVEYETFYPENGMHEQDIADWWKAVAESTRELLRKTNISPDDIKCIALSGASLVAIPMSKENEPLMSRVPIWSDMRAEQEAGEFFEKIVQKNWYMTTGNGFPAPCYSIFKLMWLKKHKPDVFEKTEYVLGSKDYINFKLTGNAATDYSYASGTGAYDLCERKMRTDYLKAADLPENIFLNPVASHTVIGTVTQEAAEFVGLKAGTKVVCGGVDNACMALGSVGVEEGKVYVSLGSSSWIPVISRQPVLDYDKKPFVFAHIEEGMFTSAFSIFSGGSSLRWAREILFADCKDDDIYRKMDELAATAEIGADGVFFNPSLAGGTSQDKSIHIRGAFEGLHLGTTRADMVRAVMEGIAFNLRISLGHLSEKIDIADKIMFCGGGSKSPFWMQMFADIFGRTIEKTNIDQDAASLGAAAIAARGMGIWENYKPLEQIKKIERLYQPNEYAVSEYNKIFPVFVHINEAAAKLGDYMYSKLRNEVKK